MMESPERPQYLVPLLCVLFVVAIVFVGRLIVPGSDRTESARLERLRIWNESIRDLIRWDRDRGGAVWHRGCTRRPGADSWEEEWFTVDMPLRSGHVTGLRLWPEGDDSWLWFWSHIVEVRDAYR